MPVQDMRPKFGAPKKAPQYYLEVAAFIGALRPTKTLRQIATMLNQANYRSPTDLPFCRQTVSNFIRNKSI